MYYPLLTPTEKCLAFAISDHLNCVTMDCWPAQATLARLLGYACTKTIKRAARTLEQHRLITITNNRYGKSEYRYSPIFLPEDMAVTEGGQSGPSDGDTPVRESFLGIRSKSYSTATEISSGKVGSFSRSSRGAYEVKVAEMLGRDGFEILAQLGAIDDSIITALCSAAAEGALSERDLAAARLAAKQGGLQ